MHPGFLIKSTIKEFQITGNKFLNQDTAFFVGADKIGQKKQIQVVLFPFLQKMKRGLLHELAFSEYRRTATI